MKIERIEVFHMDIPLKPRDVRRLTFAGGISNGASAHLALTLENPLACGVMQNIRLERAVYQKAGYWGREARLGDHPALLIIDVTQDFTGGPSPQQAEAYATACGGSWEAVAEIALILLDKVH